MNSKKFMHYGIKTSDNFLAKDSRTNCLEIYEDEASAKRVVNNSKQDIEVFQCFVYSDREHKVVIEMYEILEHLSSIDSEDAKLYMENSSDIIDLLAKARGKQ